jgi:hypothetical protein
VEKKGFQDVNPFPPSVPLLPDTAVLVPPGINGEYEDDCIELATGPPNPPPAAPAQVICDVKGFILQ